MWLAKNLCCTEGANCSWISPKLLIICPELPYSRHILLNVPSHVANVLLQWRVDTKYILMYKGQTCTVPTFKGVRQGCRGAPFFWASFVALILNEVAQLTSDEWMHSSCTFYADDGDLCF